MVITDPIRLTLVTYAAASVATALLLRSRLASPQAFAARATRAVPVSEEREWMVRVNNGATVMGYAFAVLVHLLYFEGSEMAVFFLSPILLLHLQDTEAPSHNGVSGGSGGLKASRYFPVTTAMSSLLVGAVAIKILMARSLVPLHLLQAAKVATWNGRVTVQHLAMLAAVTPTHAGFNLYLFNRRRQNEVHIAMLMPLCILPILFAELPAMRLLGLYGLVGGSAHLYGMHRSKKEGLKMI
jgi:hypothetical protein